MTTANATPQVRVRLSGRDGLLSAIPTFLGNHPSDSLVLAFFVAGGNVLGPVARLDLADVQGKAGVETASQMIGLAERNNLDRVIAVLYTDEPELVTDIDSMIETLCSTGIELRDLFVTPNAPAEICADMVAAQAFVGRSVLADREAVARSVEYCGSDLDEDTAQLVAQMATIAERDAMMAKAIGDTAVWLPVLVSAAQCTPDTDVRSADLLAVLAATAYRAGDGVVANVAIDRALRIQPDHSLAGLLTLFISACMAPADLDEIVSGL